MSEVVIEKSAGTEIAEWIESEYATGIMSDHTIKVIAQDIDECIAQAVAAERARCLEILCYPRKHFSAAYPDWMVWLIEIDMRNGVEQPKRGE